MWTGKLSSASAFHTVHLSVCLPAHSISNHPSHSWQVNTFKSLLIHVTQLSKIECGSCQQVYITTTFSLPLSWAMWYLPFPPKSLYLTVMASSCLHVSLFCVSLVLEPKLKANYLLSYHPISYCLQSLSMFLSTFLNQVLLISLYIISIISSCILLWVSYL